MPADAPAPAPRLLAPEVAALRRDLRDAEYTSSTLAELIGPVAEEALGREDPVPALRELTRRDSPAADLFLLLLLGRPLPRDRADRALARLGADGAQRLGLVTTTTDEVRPLIELSPCTVRDALGEVDWWIASDLSERATGTPLGPDHVMGVGGASLALARLTPRAPVGRVLDLGCGSGIQALLASRHAEHVVASDLSSRALEFAAFTAALNEVDLDLRHGSMLDPVAEERFDLLVSNPPFVITPRGLEGPTWTYRDGGEPGDSLLGALLARIPAHLAPGGDAVMLGNWEITAETDWDRRPRSWIERTGLDAWVIQREQVDPAQYAGTWARDGGVLPREARWQRLITAWLEDFETRETTGIGLGQIILHRPEADGDPVQVFEELTGSGSGTLSQHVAATMRQRRVLASTSDEQLLQLRPVHAEDVLERRHLVPGEPDPVLLELVQGRGFARVVRADQLLAAVVGACDGTLTLGQIIAAVCALTDTEPGTAHAQLLPQLRMLVGAELLEVS